MISHATSQETLRQTHSLNMFSGPMINHATSQEILRQTHSLGLFSGPLITQKKKKGISIYLLDYNQHLSLALHHFLTVLPWGCSCICLSTSSKFIITYILL